MIYKPPMNIAERNFCIKSVFLAGTIDNNQSYDWQSDMSEFFLTKGFNVFNPRRDDWDSTWKAVHENPNFVQQVKWERTGLKYADLILMYFAGNSMSPISLLEFGRYLDSGKMAVVCDENFYRKGNVHIECEESNVPLFTNFDDYKNYIDLLLNKNLL
jgi:hypothetical protein